MLTGYQAACSRPVFAPKRAQHKALLRQEQEAEDADIKAMDTGS